MNFATLPDRTVAMFARMGDPDAIAELRLRVKKYAPDQPRDDHGRFASDGSTDVSSPTIQERITNTAMPAGWNSDVAKYVSENPQLKMFSALQKTDVEQKQFLQTQFAKHLDGLSRQEEKAIKTYLERGNSVNSYLSVASNPAINTSGFDQKLLENAKLFSDTVDNSVKITEDVILERGMASVSGYIGNPAVGDIVTGSGGVISTTIQPSIAEQFASGMYLDDKRSEYHGGDETASTIWHIYAPAGTTALGINLEGTRKQVAEGEVVLPSDTKFEIIGKTTTEPTIFMDYATSGKMIEPVFQTTHIWAKVVS
jgi:hypothetical protein